MECVVVWGVQVRSGAIVLVCGWVVGVTRSVGWLGLLGRVCGVGGEGLLGGVWLYGVCGCMGRDSGAWGVWRGIYDSYFVDKKVLVAL